MVHRSLSNVVFARSDNGSVNTTELFLIYSLLRDRGVLMCHHLGVYWERVTRNASGVIRCGGPIIDICAHFGISFGIEDIIKIDQNGHTYCPQESGDHFPLPSPELTRVMNFEYRDNWKKDTPAHVRVITAFPHFLPWQLKRAQIGGPFGDPNDMVGPSGLAAMLEDDDANDGVDGDDDNDDNIDNTNVSHPQVQMHHAY